MTDEKNSVKRHQVRLNPPFKNTEQSKHSVVWIKMIVAKAISFFRKPGLSNKNIVTIH